MIMYVPNNKFAKYNNKLTLSIPNILGLLDESSDIDKSIMEMITRDPSIIFQPEVKYASGP